MTRKAVLTFVLLAVLVLGACAPKSSLPTVRAASYTIFDPTYIAIEKGMFAKRGINVEMVGSNFGGPSAVQAVASGKADTGISATMTIISAVAAGLPIGLATELQTEMKDSPKEIMLVKHGTYTSADQLRGKTIGVNNIRASFYYTWLLQLSKYGIAEGDVKFILLPFSAMPEALLKGEVDAIGLIEPFGTVAQVKYPEQMDILFTGYDAFGPRQFTGLFVNTIWAKDHPAAAAAFKAAEIEAMQWANANPAEANAIEGPKIGTDPEQMPVYKFAPSGAVSLDDIRYWLDWMRKAGFLDKSGDWIKAQDIALP